MVAPNIPAQPVAAQRTLAEELREIVAEQRDPDKRGLNFGPSEIADACERAAWQLSNSPLVMTHEQAWAVIATCGQGVLFPSLLDARWTLTGEGAGADGFGYPSIGEAFRECYPLGLKLYRVQLTRMEGGAA